MPGERVPARHGKPVVEVLVEGELSPFEHEAFYQLLRRRFKLEQPSYTELPDEDLATRVNIVFHHPYALTFFTEVIQADWRDLKELFKQVRYRRGKAGAAFNISFRDGSQLMFKSGLLDDEEMSSAIDQIAHLTSIIGKMTRPETMEQPLSLIECFYDKTSDRWHGFRGFSLSGGKEKLHLFDETIFKWVAAGEVEAKG